MTAVLTREGGVARYSIQVYCYILTCGPSSGSATSHTLCRHYVMAVSVSPGCCQEGSGGQEASISGGAWSVGH